MTPVVFTVSGPLIVGVALVVLATSMVVASRSAPVRPPRPGGWASPPPEGQWPPAARPRPD